MSRAWGRLFKVSDKTKGYFLQGALSCQKAVYMTVFEWVLSETDSEARIPVQVIPRGTYGGQRSETERGGELLQVC